MSEKSLSEKVDALIQDGMTGNAIAERAGCDSSTISRIRRGLIGNPAYSVGIAIDQMYAELSLRKAAA
ncbi:hypothetical protein QAO71_10570 [Halopseudomonas sp. SMJS2]|uniref:hypothetical protein n=1 Tax=Halopseudomonas sp. SMJS2 TaxID=3041098 RepID=UPI002453698C|nr:hypothetical protein [Halopseudomonas sp. SMJS2]WGK60536.1 hypothetical protein QAO71_10570 [Halopseudomonas sp. SMJS2]